MKIIPKLVSVLMISLLAGCQDLLMDNTLTNLDRVAADKARNTAEAQLTSGAETASFPELTFKKNQNGRYRLIIKDKTISEPGGTGRIKVTLTARHEGGGDVHELEEVSFTFQRVMSIPMPAGTGNYTDQIVEVNIVYSFSEGGEKTWNFHVWVSADGTTALQQPGFGGVTLSIGDLAGDGIQESIRGEVTVLNDPANAVHSVELQLKQTAAAPALGNSQITASNAGPCETNQKPTYGQCWVFSGLTSFKENPQGHTYTVIATIKDAKGNTVGQPVTTAQVIQKSDFNGRIRRVRIRESGEGSNEYKIIGTVEGDTKNEVAFLDIKFVDPTDGPMPIPTHAIATFKNNNEETERARYEFSPLAFQDSDPAGKTYTVQATMLGGDGKPLANPAQLEVSVEGLLKGVSKVAIKETAPGTGKFIIGALVENINEKRLGYVGFTFSKPIAGPLPNQTSFQLRKRPEMLFEEWENEIDDYVSEIQNNPIFTATEPDFNPLFFEMPPLGKTYAVVTTIYNPEGKPIGKPQQFQVTVEGTAVSDEPVLLSSTVTSKDGGATWDITVKIEDKANWVEKMVYEFTKPYAGPAPLVNPVSLVRAGEVMGGVKTFSATGIKFESNPVGITYSALITGFGTGTRRTTSQANNKAELL